MEITNLSLLISIILFVYLESMLFYGLYLYTKYFSPEYNSGNDLFIEVFFRFIGVNFVLLILIGNLAGWLVSINESAEIMERM